MSKREVTVNNIKYQNLKALAKAYNISYSTFKSRLLAGLSLEEALTRPISDNRKGVTVEYEGKTYESIRSFCTENNLSYGALLKRLQNGDSLEEAVLSQTKYEYRGVCYSSLRELVDAYGVNYHAVFMRLGRGFDLEEAMEKTRSISYNGKEYTCLKDLARATGIKYTTLNDRLKRGWDLEKAITTPAIKR